VYICVYNADADADAAPMSRASRVVCVTAEQTSPMQIRCTWTRPPFRRRPQHASLVHRPGLLRIWTLHLWEARTILLTT